MKPRMDVPTKEPANANAQAGAVSAGFPAPWWRSYSVKLFGNDVVAAVVLVAILLPQSLAYAMLAGLPAHVGLYASVLPLILYALLGGSPSLSIGPMALIALMTATACAEVTSVVDTATYGEVAVLLAVMSGLWLLLLAQLRLGFLANFLSYPVTTGFISAAGILIGLSQLKHMLGVDATGSTLLPVLCSVYEQLQQSNMTTLVVGVVALVVMLWLRAQHQRQERAAELGKPSTNIWKWLYRASPVVLLLVSVAAVAVAKWHEGTSSLVQWGQGVAIVGDVPSGLPELVLPRWDVDLVLSLLLPSLLIAVMIFAQSISMAQSLAARKRQRIRSNKELRALGACNLGSALLGGFPVSASLSRSAVVDAAGVETPAHGLWAAVLLVLACAFLLPWVYYLPKAVLAAIVMVSVVSLVRIGALFEAWRYSRNDAWAAIITFVCTLLLGVEQGLLIGVMVSIGLHVYRSSVPHIAEIGLVPGTQHFRNVQRHEVEAHESLLGIRLDESLYFANVRALEDFINQQTAYRQNLRHVVLMCAGINDVDASGIEGLKSIEKRLEDAKIQLHLSEVKGPIQDKLNQAGFFDVFDGQVFLTHYRAVEAIQNLNGE